jgi:UMF1 family MFS transporter
MARLLTRPPILSWALFDVANSSFTTLVITFIYSAYFAQAMSPTGEDLTPLWTLGISASAVAIAVLAPLVGAIADRGAMRKRALLGVSAVCIVGTASLYWLEPGQAVIAITVVAIANVCFEIGNVFYNSFLPDLAPQPVIGRVSGFGWGLGYIGSIAAMLFALYGLVQEGPLRDLVTGALGIPVEGGANVRATMLLVAVWFALFALPFALVVREPTPKRPPVGAGRAVRQAVGELRATFRELRGYRQIVRLLVARLVYNDGLIVIFAMGSIFAVNVFGFELSEIILFGVVINVAAGIGAIAMGFLDDRIGGRNTILLSLVGLTVASAGVLLSESRTLFWAAAVLVGLMVGPNQSASRSLLGRFVPDDKESEFFGFFAFSGRATAFMGTFLYGVLLQSFGSHRAGMAVTLLFFVVGGLLLLRVDEAEGIRLSGRPTVPSDAPPA